MLSKKHPERIFGEYTLKQKLGVGGMATVYYAIHNKLQRGVAIKIIHEHFADDVNAIKRLEREAQITQKLKHPNIVPIITFNTVDNRPYLVMPYYAGKTLADYFHQPRAVTHNVTLKILSKLAGALDYAHSNGVIHRDFKLENILLNKRNEPAISDFGIAQVANTTRLTATGNFLGTPQYMAPEQAYSGYHIIDYRADLYALGVMAYLMLTGVYPFTSTDPIQLIIKHTTQAVPLPTVVNTDLPPGTDSVLLRALAKKPASRYPSATDFVKSLESALRNISPITTMIDMQKLNLADLSHQSETNPVNLSFSEIATRNLDAEPDVISAFSDSGIQETRRFSDKKTGENSEIIEDNDQKKKNVFLKRLPVLSLLALLMLFAGIAVTLVIVSSNNNPEQSVIVGDTESTEDLIEDVLIGDNIEETLVVDTILNETAKEDVTGTLTQTALASNTSRPTSTARASVTRRPTATVSSTNTVRPSNTPISSTSVPVQATSVPVQATNVPVQATNVPVQATNVPVQPTNVPVQPTNVPVQPTNAPVVPIVNTVVPDVGCELIIGC